MLDKLKKALEAAQIVSFDEAPAPAATATPAAAKGPAVASAKYTAPTYDQDMLTSLNKVIAARKTPYTALLEQAARLESVIHDENVRLKAAFATIAGEGQRSLEGVIQGIDIHIADIERERMSFKRNAAAQVQAKAGALRGEAARRTSATENAEQRLKQLEDERQRLVEQRSADMAAADQANRDADSAEAEVRLVEQRFDLTADHLKSNLESRRSYLGSVLR